MTYRSGACFSLAKTQLVALLAALLLAALCSQAQDADLRTRYGTRSMAAATALDNAIELAQQRQLQDALVAVKTAVASDPDCDLAHFWHAIILADTGEIDAAFQAYGTIIERARKQREGDVTNVAIESAINLGLLYGRLSEHHKSIYWLSQAVWLDLQDLHHLHWKAYRNMAISSFEGGDPFSATFQALKARELAPTRVEDAMIREIASAVRDVPACVNILRFSDKPASALHTPRGTPVQLRRAESIESRLQQGHQATAMFAVPGMSLFFITYDKNNIADVVDSSSGKITTVEFPFPVRAGAATRNGLYLCDRSSALLAYTDFKGNLKRRYELPGTADAVAVCPVTGQAFLIISESVHMLDLKDGTLKPTDMIGNVLGIDSSKQLVYSTYKPRSNYGSGQMIINGRPVFFSSMGDVFSDQNMVFKGAYKAGGHSTLGAIRADAASNGYTMSLSGDGKWITVTGGGGYRGPGGKGGYGTGVLAADDMAILEGFYPIKAYPKASTFNPVTDQLALLATQEMSVFNLGDPVAGFVEAGEYASVAGWSSEGRLLFAGMKDKGVRVYQNTLDANDTDKYRAMQNEATAGPPGRAADGQAPTDTPREPVKRQDLAGFAPASTMPAAKAKAMAGAKSETIKGPAVWSTLSAYAGNDDLARSVRSIIERFKPEEAGVAVYKAREVLRQHPDYTPARFALGFARKVNNNRSEAQAHLLQVVREDAGQSTLTTDALCLLADMYLQDNKEPEALDCLATCLLVDKDHATARRMAAPLMKKNGIAFENAITTPGGASVTGGAKSVTAKPKLTWPAHRKASRILSAEELFHTMASKVVSIKTDTGYGSGIFITDDGYLLTNHHVVSGANPSVDVTMFTVSKNRITRNGTSSATVVFADRENDIAVLKVARPAVGTRGLSLAKEDPATGARVYAIGSPALGNQLLEQSLTDGIVSANNRVIDNRRWIQHSASIHPGCSGGPLVSERGEIIGLVTLKASLNAVSFAIPPTLIREVLGQP